MAGFCKTCGNLLENGQCSDHPPALVKSPLQPPVPIAKEVGPLPPASRPRRLLGSGIEYVTYVLCAWVVTALDLFTGGVAGLLALGIAALILLRDLNAGALSIAKRVSQMRVVDWKTGQPASNLQGLVRNFYYFGLLIVAAFLPFGDVLSSLLFTLFIVLDLAIIFANPRGRRFGDILAGTQVIEARI